MTTSDRTIWLHFCVHAPDTSATIIHCILLLLPGLLLASRGVSQSHMYMKLSGRNLLFPNTKEKKKK